MSVVKRGDYAGTDYDALDPASRSVVDEVLRRYGIQPQSGVQSALGAAGAMLGAGADAAANNRGSMLDVASQQEQLNQSRQRQTLDSRSARSAEGRASGNDAFRNMQRAEYWRTQPAIRPRRVYREFGELYWAAQIPSGQVSHRSMPHLRETPMTRQVRQTKGAKRTRSSQQWKSTRRREVYGTCWWISRRIRSGTLSFAASKIARAGATLKVFIQPVGGKGIHSVRAFFMLCQTRSCHGWGASCFRVFSTARAGRCLSS